jgi:FKBP-type peptidyl-prolyl cis-trans isomerase FkpA
MRATQPLQRRQLTARFWAAAGFAAVCFVLVGCGDPVVRAAAKEPGARKLDSGVVFRSLRPGTGAIPLPGNAVRVHYIGKLADGKVFNNSYENGSPILVSLRAVVPCWQEGIPLMRVGEKAKLVCPPHMGYGREGRPPKIPSDATLIFEIELLRIGD